MRRKGSRDFEHRRHANFRLAFSQRLCTREMAVQAWQRVLHDVDLAVVGHLAQRLGVAQILVFQIDW